MREQNRTEQKQDKEAVIKRKIRVSGDIARTK